MPIRIIKKDDVNDLPCRFIKEAKCATSYAMCEMCSRPNDIGWFFSEIKGKRSWTRKFILEKTRAELLASYGVAIQRLTASIAETEVLPSKDEFLSVGEGS